MTGVPGGGESEKRGAKTREQRSGVNAYDTTYTYDPVGNRLIHVSSGATTTYSYDAANEVLTSEDASGVTTFSYDANGNTAGEIRPNGDRVTYTWDIENHLTKMELPANVVNTITLDGDGKRRTIEDSDRLRNIIWDLHNILGEIDDAGNAVVQYTQAPEGYGELISQRRAGATSFHHFDALGSTHKLTDVNGATVIEYLYRAFGQQVVLSGTSPNRFTWVGRLGYYRQPDPDDYWVRARITKPRPGRWLARDPLCQSDRELVARGCYTYSRNKPTVEVDPSGLACPNACIWRFPGVTSKYCKDFPKGRQGRPSKKKCLEADLRRGIHWDKCMAIFFCKNQWAKYCEDVRDAYNRRGGTVGIAETGCCEDECGECKPVQNFTRHYDKLSQCEQICTQVHEAQHAVDCRRGNPSRCTQRSTECEAYTASWHCLERFLPKKPT